MCATAVLVYKYAVAGVHRYRFTLHLPYELQLCRCNTMLCSIVMHTVFALLFIEFDQTVLSYKCTELL
jgi:hypothetical protein